MLHGKSIGVESYQQKKQQNRGAKNANSKAQNMNMSNLPTNPFMQQGMSYFQMKLEP
jgi:hypothetical protein